MQFTWPQALAWRLRRQLLDPVRSESVEEVVHRLGAVPAQPDHSAELAVRARRQQSEAGEVAAAVADGRLVKTYAFRGATHLMTPQDAAVHLALRASTRMWELPSWQSFYQLAPADWPAFREVVRDALVDGPLTREELAASVAAERRFAHLADAFTNGSDTLLKPLAWQGDLSLGPPRGQRAAFQRLDGNPRWPGLLDLDDAGPRAVRSYVGAYGPTDPGPPALLARQRARREAQADRVLVPRLG